MAKPSPRSALGGQRNRVRTSYGQATVELVALLPLLALAGLAVAHLALAGHAVWAASQAAGAAARAHAVGLDARLAARTALPAHLEHRLKVRTVDDGRVELRLRVPTLIRHLDLGDLTVAARFEPQA